MLVPNCKNCGIKLVKVKDKDYWGCPAWRPNSQGCEGDIWWPEKERQRTYPNVLFSLKIESKSQPGHFHQVKFYESGNIWCDCVAASMSKFCSHQKKATEKIVEIIDKIKQQNGGKTTIKTIR